MIDGDLRRVVVGDPGSPVAYTVILGVAGRDPEVVMQRVATVLTGVGFVGSSTPSTPRISSASFRSATYEVAVNVVRAKARTTVTYVVLR